MRPTVLVIGPTPPPLQGMSVFTGMLVRPGGLDRACDVVHLDTADRRSMENMGRFDVRNVWLALAHAWRLFCLSLRRRPDVVYTPIAQNRLGYLRDVVLMAIARLTGRTVVVHLHGSAFRGFHDTSGPVMRWVIRRSLGWARDVVVLSERFRWIFHGLVPPDRIRVAAAGIADPFPDGPPPVRDGDETVTVGYLGLFFQPKGFLAVLAAAAELNRSKPGRYRFRFAGDWFSHVERQAAAEMLAEDGLDDAVELLGSVTGAEKRAFLASLDIVCFAGTQPEGLPLVVMEAMAAGRAIVATPVGSIADAIVTGETGVVVPPGDQDALVNAIARLAPDPAARRAMGRAARQTYLDHYTEDRCIERMVGFLTAEGRCG